MSFWPKSVIQVMLGWIDIVWWIRHCDVNLSFWTEFVDPY